MILERGFDPSRVYFDPADMHRIRPLYLDKSRFGQVVYNLLTNSIKYADDDPLKFEIRISVGEKRDAFVVRFRDWGMGVKKEYAEKIFEEGFRSPEAISKNVTGSGLGLTIARQIMREFGGDLRMVNESKPTEFTVILPKSLE